MLARYLQVSSPGLESCATDLGALADRRGRRFVIKISLGCGIILQLAFGMSPSFAVALVARFLGGLSNGIVAAAKAAAPDLVPAHENAAAMSLISGMWGLGNIVGPSTGGLLAEYDPWAGPGSLLGMYPYLLPNLLSALLTLLALLAVTGWLPETGSAAPGRLHSPKQPASDAPEWQSGVAGLSHANGTGSGAGAATAEARHMRRKCCASIREIPPGAWPPCVAYCLVAFVSIIFEEVRCASNAGARVGARDRARARVRARVTVGLGQA